MISGDPPPSRSVREWQEASDSLARARSWVRQPSVKALRKLAPPLGVSLAWLETGEEDSAVALAQLVLVHEGKRVPHFAIALARRVLHEHGSEPPSDRST